MPKGAHHPQRCLLPPRVLPPPKVPMAPGCTRGLPEGLEQGDASTSPSCPLELLLPGGLNLYNFSFFLLKTKQPFFN